MIRLPLKSFQARVAGWMQQCFGAAIAADVRERGDRFLEEALELLQSHGYDPARVARLRDYVWSRPIGEPAQEVGGVMVTLAAYCTATSIDLDAAGEAELARILSPEVVERIRQKQETKRDIHSPLPSADPACSCPSGDGSLRWPCPAHLLTADRTAIRLLVAAGHVTEGKANEALNIAHGFDKGPLAQAQGAGEVVAGTSKATLHRDRAGCEWFIVTSDESPDDESEVTPSDDPALFAFLRAVTAPPSAPVGVEGGWLPGASAPEDTKVICAWLGAPGCSEVDVAVLHTDHAGTPYWCSPHDAEQRFSAPDLWQPFPALSLEALAQQPAAGADDVLTAAYMLGRHDGRKQPAAVDEATEPLFYLQDSRSYVGNCPLWWCPDGKGYTTRLDEAGRFTRDYAMSQCRSRGTDVPWPCEQIDAIRRPTVDMQDMRALAQPQGGA